MVAARARLVQAKQDGVGVEEAQAAVATAREKQKVTKKGKSGGGARGGAFFSAGASRSNLCTIPAAFSEASTRAPL